MSGVDAVERVIRPVVEGQLRSFLHDHPQILNSVNWYKSRKDKRITFVNSVAKRIIRDLLCEHNLVRLGQATSGIANWGSPEGHTETLGGVRGLVATSGASEGAVEQNMPRPHQDFDPDAFAAELERRLAQRKQNRPAYSARSLKGAATKRRTS